jgi:uncharacterized membrane protein YhaH (DUF805 family)
MSNIINCYVDMWKNFANFSGRTSVGGYWWAYLGNIIVSIVLGLIGVEVLITVYSLATLIPTLSIAVRRLRDAGKGWGWLFITLVPLVGWIIFIVMMCKPSVNDNIVDAL